MLLRLLTVRDPFRFSPVAPPVAPFAVPGGDPGDAERAPTNDWRFSALAVPLAGRGPFSLQIVLGIGTLLV